MSAAHLHLVLNHAPLFGIVFAALGLAWALARKDDGVARAALGLLVLAGVLALPVYLTGEEAEEVIEHRVGVSEAAIEAHEEAALGSAIAVGAVGAVALIVLIGFRKRTLPRPAMALVLALALGAGGWIGYVANLGGQISHPEVRSERLGGPAPAPLDAADRRDADDDHVYDENNHDEHDHDESNHDD